MDLEHERPDVLADLKGVKNREELEAVMQRLVNINGRFREPGVLGRKLHVGWLDRMIPVIANTLRLKDAPPVAKSNERIVLIATVVRPTGGHSRVISDFTRGLPGQVTHIYTDLYEELPEHFGHPRDLHTAYEERAWLIIARRRIVDRIVELYMQLKAIQPTRILLFGHPMDMVAITAAWPFRHIAEFVHHVDYVPAVGATLPFSAHIDLTYTCHLACRSARVDALFAGMAAPMPDTPPKVRPLTRQDEIVFCTSGSPHKFRRAAGAFGWGDYVKAVLTAAPRSRIVHVGEAEPDIQADVDRALREAGADAGRYQVIGYVPSVSAELRARGVDIYLSSYPESGGKATLEAMGAGLPVILPQDADDPPLIRFDHPLGGWVAVQSPDEIAAAIDQALAMREGLASPERAAQVAAELGRFHKFVEGRLAELR